MSYEYEKEKHVIFTDEGQRMFLKIRDNVRKCLRTSGAITMGAAISASGVTGDLFAMLACVDRLVELKEIREIFLDGYVAEQDRIFVSYDR
jgi:hypothetical protein